MAPDNDAFGRDMLPGQFDTSGTLVYAENVGGPAVTFDGILFGSGEAANPDRIDFGRFSTSYSSASAVTIQRYGTWQTSGIGLVQFDNLTIGQDYLIQALVYDGRPGSFGRAVEFDGVELGQFGNGVVNVRWGPGILASGSFTADAVTQSFDVEIFTDTSYTTSLGPQLNAVSLHAVPEPASLAIWAGGGLAMLAASRRRSQKVPATKSG